MQDGSTSVKRVTSINLHGEIGLGVGLTVDGFFSWVKLQWIIAKLNADLTGSCESDCGSTTNDCCKVCDETKIDLPFVLPFTELSIGLFSFTLSGNLKITGSVKACYNSSGCKTQGLAIGFCGTLELTGTITYGWAYIRGGEVYGGCTPLLGTEDMLK